VKVFGRKEKFMKIVISKYNTKDEAEWDFFVKDSNNGTLFHLRAFLSYHLNKKFRDHSLICKIGEKIKAVFPAAIIEENGKKILFSHPGTSYGGFITDDPSFTLASEILKAFEVYCQKQNFQETFLIPPPWIYHTRQSESFEYAMLWNNYIVDEIYISSVIPLMGDNDEIIKNVCRLKHRSQKYFEKIIEEFSITTEWNSNFDEFYPILMNNKKRHNSKPTHSLLELNKLMQLFPSRLHLLMMYSKGKPIGGTLNFIANEKVAIIFYNMIDYDYIQAQAATLQIMETIKWAKKRGFSYLDFGVSQNPKAKNPLTPAPSLIRFKEEFGSLGMIRKAFRKVF
jgi:hypothetical protein